MPGKKRYVEPETWTERAACKGMGPSLFVAGEGTVAGRAATAEALKVCGGCAVTAECLDYAKRIKARYGVWGGMTVVDIKGRRRSRARPRV